MEPLTSDNMQPFESDLAELLESNLANKAKHIDRLKDHYNQHEDEITAIYATWKDLTVIDVPAMRPQMDDAFYKFLDEQVSDEGEQSTRTVPIDKKKSSGARLRWLSPMKLAVAATFILGMMAGQWLDFGSITPVDDQSIAVVQEDNQVLFASLERTPSAMKRIQGINEVKYKDDPDLKIIDALNKVILNDPNVNVRLTAIETMVAFSHIPEARAYLIEAIPHQDSPIVQLELADVMIALEEKSSAEQWNQLLESDKIETETRIHLKESLRKIL